MPSSLGRRYIVRTFVFTLNSSVLAVVWSWFLYRSAPSILRLWLPWSRICWGVATLLAGLLVGVVGFERGVVERGGVARGEVTRGGDARGVGGLGVLFLLIFPSK